MLAHRAARFRGLASSPAASAPLSSSPPSSRSSSRLRSTFLRAHLQNVVLAEWAPLLLVLAVRRVSSSGLQGSCSSGRSSLSRSGSSRTTRGTCPGSTTRRCANHSLLHVEHLTYLAAGSASGGRSSTADTPPARRPPTSSPPSCLRRRSAYCSRSSCGRSILLRPRSAHLGPGPLADQQIAGVTMALRGGDRLLRSVAPICSASSPTSRREEPSGRARRHQQAPFGRSFRAAPGSARPRH